MTKKICITLVASLGTYLLLWLGFAAGLGYFQPQSDEQTLVRTFDVDGVGHDTVLRPVTGENGRVWLLSGQWFRSWYNRALENPKVEMVHSGTTATSYKATPVNEEAEVDRILELRTEGANTTGMYIQRALLLFAPVKILRLEPVD